MTYMFKRIIELLKDINSSLSRRVRIGIIITICIVLSLLGYLIYSSINNISTEVKNKQDSDLIGAARERIARLGNPFDIPTESLLNKYPFNINDRVKDNTYLVEVSTSMLNNPVYNDLLNSDEQLRNCLNATPTEHTGVYQVFYDVNTSLSANPCQRMTNFNKIRLDGSQYWFMEENDQYWVQLANTNQLSKVNRSLSLLPPFTKLVPLSDNQFLATNKDESTIDLQYIVLKVLSTTNASVKTGTINYAFLDNSNTLVDPNFTGAVSASQVLPDVYPINSELILQKSLTSSNATYTLVNISSVESPQLLKDLTFTVRELNSIYTTCSLTKEKCWIYNPGVKSIIQVDNKGKTSTLTPTIDTNLTEIQTSLKLTFEPDKIIKYNQESDEILFFYQGKWVSIYRF
jgi:hypothetical protein